jgi:hypothetical protein
MSAWTLAYRDTDKTIERRATSATDADGLPVYEERVTYTNAAAPEARLDALTEAVDTLILDSLGGL